MLHFNGDGEFVWATKEELVGLQEYHNLHPEIPFFAVAAYLIFLYVGPKMISSPWNVKPLLVIWNVLLAIFSMLGSYYLVVALKERVETVGFEDSICSQGGWWFADTSGFFVVAFCYSKFPELIDTVFLIIRKKEVIFLHWYHHVTVLLFCWHSLSLTPSMGIWFAVTNFCVHSIMYSYYALAILGVKAVFKFSMAITILQILQMVGGMSILCFVCWKWWKGEKCYNDPTNTFLGLIMYGSYFFLFGALFVHKYVSSKAKAGQKKRN